MSKIHVYTRSLLSNWTGYIAYLVVAYFLTPFITSSLGTSSYGAWSLVMAVVGHLGMVEIGVRVSTGRFINYYLGKGENQKVSEIVCTSLAFFTGVGLLALLLAGFLGLFFSKIVEEVPVDLARQIRWVLPILGANVWVGLFGSTFGQCLVAYNRFDFRNLYQLTGVALRAGGAVWTLSRGYGLVGLSIVHLVAGLVEMVMALALARWKGPKIHYGLGQVKASAAKEVFTFGGWAFVRNVSDKIVNYTDSFVIIALLGLEAVAFYNIGHMLVDRARTAISQVVSVMLPDLTQAASRRDYPAMRWMVIQGTKATMFVTVPLLLGLIMFGRDFLALWLDPEYHKSGMVMLILAVAHLMPLYCRAPIMALWGMGHVKVLAAVAVVEAVINLGLSVVFVVSMGWGINGVALGTLFPMLFITTIFCTIYCCKKIELSLLMFLTRTLPGPAAAGAVFAAMCIAIRHYFPPTIWSSFWMDVTVVTVVYLPIGLVAIFGPSEGKRLLSRAMRFFKRPVQDGQ